MTLNDLGLSPGKGRALSAQVCERMREAARAYVSIDELQRAVGVKMGRETGFPSGWVVSGARAGCMLVVAALITGGDRYLASLLPRNGGGAWVAVPESEAAMDETPAKCAGARVLRVSSKEDACGARAILTSGAVDWANAATLIVLPKSDSLTPARVRGWAKDASALILPGSAVGAPEQTACVLCNQEIADALAILAAPHHGIGRSFKIGKEEIVGACYALLQWMKEGETGA